MALPIVGGLAAGAKTAGAAVTSKAGTAGLTGLSLGSMLPSGGSEPEPDDEIPLTPEQGLGLAAAALGTFLVVSRL